MKRVFAVLLAAACLLALGACGKKEDQKAGMANPWKEAASLAEAAAEVGFSLNAPEALEGYESKTIRVCIPEGSRIIEVTFRNVNDETVCIRKGEGSEDISGDYNQYDAGGTMDVDGMTVNMRANGESIRVATWQKDGFTYSITLSAGMVTDAVVALIEQVR